MNRITGYGAVIVAGFWLSMFLTGLIIILVSGKQFENKEITQKRWEELQIPGWILLGISITTGIGFLIAFLVLLGLWLIS